MIEAHLHVADDAADKIARRVPRWIDREDLVAAARLGLVDAARRYDPDNARGATFATFAGPRVAGAVLDWLRAQDPVSRSYRARLRAEGRQAPQQYSLDAEWDIPPLAWRAWHPRDLRADYAEETAARLLRELPERWQRVLGLLYRDGLTMAEAGRRIGRSESAVSLLHKKALARMRERAAALGYRVPEGVLT